MLENAIVACPEEVWGSEIGWSEFWYLAYHPLFFADDRGSASTEGFRPPPPFTLDELDPAGLLPDRVYSKAELLAYLEFVWTKNRAFIQTLTPERARQRFVDDLRDFNLLELVISNTRHVQHHAAQLNLLLRQRTDSAPGWAARPGRGLFD